MGTKENIYVNILILYNESCKIKKNNFEILLELPEIETSRSHKTKR
jgi:hypothetical protein